MHMHIDHLTVVPDGGERIGETPAWNVGRDPCPHCGGQSFQKITKRSERVELWEDGTAETTQIADTLLEVWCRECDTRLA